jgi:predicted transcriptional regulator of viral defense system
MAPIYLSAMGWVELGRVAQEQHGVVGREEALLFVTKEQLRQALDSGRVERVFRGAYRFAGSPATWEQRLMAASRATGGVASHKSAARLWGISHVPARGIELIVPAEQVVRVDGVRAHRSNRLPDIDVTNFAGIPVTTGARTVVDISAVLGDATLERAVNDALRRGVTSIGELKECFDRLAGRGRRRIAHLRPLLEARLVGFDPGGSDAELELVAWLVDAGLPRPVQELWVVANGNRYRLDLAYPQAKVGIERDGWDDHGTRRAFDYDRERRDELELAGWLILQVTSRMTRQTVVGRVRRALQQRLPLELRAVSGL